MWKYIGVYTQIYMVCTWPGAASLRPLGCEGHTILVSLDLVKLNLKAIRWYRQNTQIYIYIYIYIYILSLDCTGRRTGEVIMDEWANWLDGFVLLLFYTIVAIFQLYHGGDMVYEMRRRKTEPTLLLTQVFYLPHHAGMVWEKLAFDDAISYTQLGNGLQQS